MVATRERQPLEAGDVMLDPSRERALVGGLAIALSRTEFSLLYSLTSAAGEIVAQESLAVDGWGDRGKSALDVAMSRLRKKLAGVPGGRGLIETVRGRGYRLSVPSVQTTTSPDFGSVAASGAD
jgi:DNA-binding response OmpR family regulator